MEDGGRRRKTALCTSRRQKRRSPAFYDPLSEYQRLILDAIDIGRMESQKKTPKEIQKEIQIFAVKYGLLGLMTALPTTPRFMDYEAVYLPKNHFILEKSMDTMDYLDLFFPFVKPDVVKRGVESMWNIQNDRAMMTLAMTMTDKPMAVNMSFQREYAEPYEWIKQQGMEAFGGNAPTYRIALLDKPTIVWDFHSLMLGIQMMFSFMLTDTKKPIRICKHCLQTFVASRPSAGS